MDDTRPPPTFDMADGYYTNEGTFKSRQHVVNHVDMLLGLTGTESGSTRDNRYIAAVTPLREHPLGLAALADLEPERLQRCRTWALGQCIFAARWEQIIPSAGDRTISPTPLTRRDAAEILSWCIDEWADGRGIDAFVAETALVVILGDWDSLVVDRVVVRRRPDGAQLERVVPANVRARVAKAHGGSDAWTTFARRVCGSGFVASVLAERQSGTCPACGMPLGARPVVHHMDYDHECRLELASQEWRLAGTRDVPDCERCHKDHPDWFEECLSRLAALHRGCNYLVDATL